MAVRASHAAIRTAVFPVAGRGTRFLPATKASPKEMLPVVDKPLIQYAVEEALMAGARRLVFITGASKRAIEDHFDSDTELENLLEAQGKTDLAEQVRSVLPRYATCIYIRQPAPLGLGHAVLCAQPAVGNAPFFVHLADDLIDAGTPCLKQMAGVHRKYRGSVLGVEEVQRNETDKYGIVDVGGSTAKVAKVRKIVEKPKPRKAPSNLAVVGRYVLTPAIFCASGKDRPRRGRRNPAHRRHRPADEDPVGLRLPLRRQALRLRQQARLPAGHRGIRPEPFNAGRSFPGLPAGIDDSGGSTAEMMARPQVQGARAAITSQRMVARAPWLRRTPGRRTRRGRSQPMANPSRSTEDCMFSVVVRDWAALDSQRFIIYGLTDSEAYLATLFFPTTDLINNLGMAVVDSDHNGRICGKSGDYVEFRNATIPGRNLITSMHRISEEEAKALLAQSKPKPKEKKAKEKTAPAEPAPPQ